jgi:[acyl-carrier-protein] S-malonyltransferase
MVVAFLFPGQGSQFAGMAGDLFDASPRVRSLFSLASDVMGQDMKKLIDESDAETLKRTDIAQPAVTLANLASAAVFIEKGIKPAAVAGHSLGEYAALAIAGVISESDCFKLVKERGLAMHKACGNVSGAGMAAVLGLPPKTIESLINEWTADGLEGLFAANFNSSRQTVISGTANALDEAEKRFKNSGAKRVVRLNVAGPFHSPLMKEAAEEFESAVKKVQFKEPSIPVFSNVTGKQLTEGTADLAVKQITSPVRWSEEEDAICTLNINTAIETGPGTVLCGLWKDLESKVPCFAGGKLADIEKVLALA